MHSKGAQNVSQKVILVVSDNQQLALGSAQKIRNLRRKTLEADLMSTGEKSENEER